ncbi:MAG: ribonuclease P protein component [Pirellulaceae bacterium]|nr:ribonuclease P protein component [Pirellulaceae bacterium]
MMDSTGKPSNNLTSASATQEVKPDESFPKSARLHSSLEFDDLFARGKVLADPMLVMHSRPARANLNGRIGISISKRVGHAPLRNRWKRLIREAYRRQVRRTPALTRLDLVVRPRRGAVPSYTAIEHSLASLAVRLDKQWHR